METLELYSLDEVKEFIKEEVKKMFELQGGKPFMNIYEAAKYLCLSPKTMYRYIQLNRISYYRKDKKVYFKRSDLDFYILNSENRYNSNLELESEADTWIAMRKLKEHLKK